MHLKEISKTATTTWGPLQYHHDGVLCPMMATGTVAGALDLTFSASSSLEIFALNMTTPGLSEGLVSLGKASTASRFNRLAWSSSGVGADRPYGLIAGGMEDGSLDLWNPTTLFQEAYFPWRFYDDFEPVLSDAKPLLHKQVHTGQLAALDFNPFQSNLLATGASDAEIFVWDLNNPDRPYNPGPKSQRLEDLTCLAWNRQVAHILGSASSNGYAVIWDLKNRREIIHLTSPTRKKITSIAWNPEVSTQILTASDDDSVPVIYMWDLRNAHAPEKVLSGHSKGVLSVAWSSKDSDLLLSCGKDNRTLCWNPRTAEIIGEFPASKNWVFDVQWCPKNPDLLSTCSFDGKVNVFSVQGKAKPLELAASQSASDPFNAVEKAFSLKQPPKWLRRPVGATFAFGNQLVCFGAKNQTVTVKQIITDPDLVQRSEQLESTIAENRQIEVCQKNAQASLSKHDRKEADVWQFLSYIFQEDAREKILGHLGFNKEELAVKMATLNVRSESPPPRKVSKATSSSIASEIIQEAFDGATLSSGGNAQVDALFGGVASDFPVSQQSPLATNSIVPLPSPEAASFSIYKNGDKDSVDAQITKCLIVGDHANAVELCLSAGRLDDALLIAVTGGPELVERTQKVIFSKKSGSSYLRLLSSITANDFQDIVDNADVVESWREVLALLCTYASPLTLPELCDRFADRLRDVSDIERDQTKKSLLQNAAVLGFIVAGRVDKLVSIWIDQQQQDLQSFVAKLDKKHVSLFDTKEYAASLQSLIEKISIFRKAVNDDSSVPLDDPVYQAQMKSLYKRYAAYSSLLSNQGQLPTALKYINLVTADFSAQSPLVGTHGEAIDMVAVQRHRLYNALELKDIASFKQVPPSPFATVDVGEGGVVAKTSVGDSTEDMFYKNLKDSSANVKTLVDRATNPTPTTRNAAVFNAPNYPGSVAPQYGGSYNPYQQQQPGQFQAPTPYAPQQQQPAQFQAPTPYAQQSYQTQQPSFAPPVPQPFVPQGQFAPNPYAQQQQQQQPFQPLQQQPYQSQQVSKPMISEPPPLLQATSQQQHLAPTGGAPVSPRTSQAVPQTGSWNDPGDDLFNKPKPKKPAVSASPAPPQFNPHQPQQTGATFGVQQQQLTSPQGGYAAQPMQSPQQQQQFVQPGVLGQSMSGGAVSPGLPKYPVGDRTHIPAEHAPIFDLLSKLLSACKTNAGPPQRKGLEDVEKRLNALFDKLNNEQVGKEALTLLFDLRKALEAKNWALALTVQTTLMTECGSKEGTIWLSGIKRLIEMARTLL